MFDLGWSELLLIGVVALIVVGPKDLPGMFRTVGQLVGKAKLMARDFTQAMNDAADDAGVSDIQRTIERAARPVSTAMDDFKKSTTSFTQQTMDSGKPKSEATPAPAAQPEQSAAEPAAVSKPAPKKQAAKKPAPKQAAAKKPAGSGTAKAAAARPKTTASKTTAPKTKPKTSKAKAASPDDDGTSNT